MTSPNGANETSQLCNASGQLDAPVTCPNVCLASGICGANPKTVFVTSTMYTANMGGLAGADARCQARATAGMLTGTYKAWLSDSDASPSTRFTKNGGPYLLPSGSKVASNWSSLTASGGIGHAINVTELLGTPPISTSACGTASVWSATSETGVGYAAGSCGGWTDTTGTSSSWGSYSRQDFWSASCSGGNMASTTCGSNSPIYCFQQ